jgi:hypothetical protein
VSLTRRGRVVVILVAFVLILGGIGAALAMSGSTDPVSNALRSLAGQKSTTPPPPPPCPLTGLPPAGGKPVPHRPVLAVKVENTTAAYPLAGLDRADIVYEELVEGGITRFMALFQCQDSLRVGPVRSARTTDPRVLRPLNAHPLIAYSGGQLAVVNMVNNDGLIGLTETNAPTAFHRDPARVAPHNLFVNTAAAYAAAGKPGKKQPAPSALFNYSALVPRGKKLRSVSIKFSYSVYADWSWLNGKWTRMYNGAPMKLEDGTPITADNVIIQQVVVTQGTLVDVLGNPSPEVTLLGSGKAWLLRNGELIPGKWSRGTYRKTTTFVTNKGARFVLRPGTTWVELAPKGQPITFTR